MRAAGIGSLRPPDGARWVCRAAAGGGQRGGQAGDRGIGEERADGQVYAVDGPDVAISRVAVSEWPPSAKKLSAHANRPRQRKQFARRMIAAIFDSAGVRGATVT